MRSRQPLAQQDHSIADVTSVMCSPWLVVFRRLQVIAVGDFNVASEQHDVHSAITWDTLYEQQELDALHALFDSCTDTWRHLHPAYEGVYTVWSEKTSARAFNVVRRCGQARVLLQCCNGCGHGSVAEVCE